MNGDLNVLGLALIVLLGMTALMRWVFKPSRPRTRTVVPGDAVPGLLRTVRTGLTRADGLALRAVLGDAGIRTSMSTRRDGRVDVSVFQADEDRARALLPPE